MNNKLKNALKLAKYLKIDIYENNIGRRGRWYGNWHNKVNEIFPIEVSKVEFSLVDRCIKTCLFDNPIPCGSSNIYGYLHRALKLFDILPSGPYSEKTFLKNGWKLRHASKPTFKSYLLSSKTPYNLHNDEKVRKNAYTAIIFYLFELKDLGGQIGKDIAALGKIANLDQEISRAKYLFEDIYMYCFKEEVPNSELLDISNEEQETLLNIKLDINKLLSNNIDLDDIELSKKFTAEYKLVMKLRRKFRVLLVDEMVSKFNNEKVKNHNLLLPSYKHTEAAHLVSVKDLIKDKKWKDIYNVNNGILVDPNFHTIMDSKNNNLNLNIKTGEVTRGSELVAKFDLSIIKSRKIFIKKCNKFNIID